MRLHRNERLRPSPRTGLIERLLLEQYQPESEGHEHRVVLKAAKAISAASLQSPHDEEVAYRKKKDQTVRGCSANVTETGGEALNLILDVQVEPATTADNTYLQGAVENSEAVLGHPVAEISAAGADYNEQNETYASAQEKGIHYTVLPGRAGRYDYERSGHRGHRSHQRAAANGRGKPTGALPLPGWGQLALLHRL